ncbi:hypothetical protein SARC_00708 [Sphaeroforma arctica JP610]|uniref:SAM-dependent RNA methyltransferase n=1 Tax=Sphaeroforma arctica JP610 TaxID=667725 RepID=A0A0L0GDU8_9EUKA|nr:hypothetical protein SARC_00708 [Sphaeroforma arctica JP610]KNC87180.1 hypothetical protein SARC_00708 [Sphaeroforma arctica JP610]|eukprot:XP_014161082.1 hypothetical protein SARC_00708 [Sphaeroforma arctica JP610]
MKYIIEHLEQEVGKWCVCEYTHMAKCVGKDNLIISNVNKEDAAILPEGVKKVSERCNELGFDPSRVCLLDLRADKELSPEDLTEFDAVVFGGILGDHPPRDRTGCLRTHGFTTRVLGNRQMSTDTAVLVCKTILEDGKKLSEIEFIDDIELKTGEKDSTLLPYRYVATSEHKPLLADGLIEILRDDEENCLF